VFGKAEGVNEYLTFNNIRDKINDYVKKECKTEKKFVLPDPFLINLFPKENEVQFEIEKVEKSDNDDSQDEEDEKEKKKKEEEEE